jgi:PmbA protein
LKEECSRLADRAVSILSEMKLRAEIYLEDGVSSTVAVSSGKVESVEVKEELGAGLRVFEEGRVGFAYTSDLGPEGLRSAAKAARALSRHTDPDPANELPKPEPSAAPDPEPGDAGVARIETYRKVALAKAMEEAARGVDSRVTKVGESRYSDLVGHVEIRNTEGYSRGAGYARVYGLIDVVAEQDGRSQSGWASDFALKFSTLDPFKIGREAARRAVAKLGGSTASSRRADVVLEPEVTASILETLGTALAADGVLKGKSFLAGQVGKEVASGAVLLVDDGRFPGGNRTFPFDGEGTPTTRTSIIEEGRLSGYLHNAYTARKMGVPSTGNGIRSSYMAPPRIEPTTMYLIPSAAGRQEVLAEAGNGLLVTELMGLHTVDSITGEFSLGAVGHHLSGGEAGDPVTGIGIAGTLTELLRGIAMVGTDLRLLPGATAGSTVLVRDLSVSGS